MIYYTFTLKNFYFILDVNPEKKNERTRSVYRGHTFMELCRPRSLLQRILFLRSKRGKSGFFFVQRACSCSLMSSPFS